MLIYKKEDNIVMGKMVLNNDCLQERIDESVISPATDDRSIETFDFFKPLRKEIFYNNGDFNCEAWDYYSKRNQDIEIDANGSKLGYDFQNRRLYCYDYNNNLMDYIQVFEMLYPNIIEMCFKGCDFFKESVFDSEYFDMTKLIKSDIRNLSTIVPLINSGNYSIWKYIKELFPEFYFFFSNIVPFATIESIDSFSLEELKKIRDKLVNSNDGVVLGKKVNTLITDTCELQKFVSSAEQTTKVLGAVKLLKK